MNLTNAQRADLIEALEIATYYAPAWRAHYRLCRCVECRPQRQRWAALRRALLAEERQTTPATVRR